MKVRDIMTAPALICTPETSLGVAARRMRDANCGVLPVVDRHGRLAGILTDRDICIAVGSSSRNANNIGVHEIMTRKALSASADDDVANALGVMRNHRVRRLPVRDESGALKGILSIEDIVVRGVGESGLAAQDVLDALRAIFGAASAASPPPGAKHVSEEVGAASSLGG